MSFLYHLYVDWNDDGVYEADESAYLDSVQIQRGRRDIFTQPYVGKMTVRLKNHTGRFTPWNTGSLISPNVAPGRRVQMIVDVNGVGYPIFSGRLDSPKTFSQKVGATPDVMTLTAQDGWRWLSDQKTNIALNTNIATGNAIVEVLSGTGWIASGVFLLGSAKLGVSGGANASNLGGAGVGENTRIDVGNDVIPNWWTADESASQSIWDLARSEFGRLQINGDGTLVFKARSSDFSTSADVQLTDSQVQEVSVDTPWEWVKNRVSVKANPRTLAGLAEVWYLRDTPYIQVGETLTLWAEFADVTGERVAVTGGVNPVATTDYTANTKVDGTGTDKTANITVTPTFFSTAAKLVITQNAGTTVYITFLHIRGQIVQAMDSQLMIADYAADQALHGVIELSVDLPWQQSTLTAKDFAVWQLAFLKTPQLAPRVVMRGQSLPFIWDLGTKVQWNSTKLGFDKTFRVGEVTYDLKKGQDVTATWLLLPTGNENFWRLDAPGVLLGVNTTLGY